jgi:hypothetical protein
LGCSHDEPHSEVFPKPLAPEHSREAGDLEALRAGTDLCARTHDARQRSALRFNLGHESLDSRSRKVSSPLPRRPGEADCPAQHGGPQGLCNTDLWAFEQGQGLVARNRVRARLNSTATAWLRLNPTQLVAQNRVRARMNSIAPTWRRLNTTHRCESEHQQTQLSWLGNSLVLRPNVSHERLA